MRLVLLGLFVTLASGPAFKPATNETLDRARLGRIAGRLDVLARDVAGFWTVHGRDAEHGGFHGTLDREGAPVPPFEKGLVQQARHLWTLSTWYERREPTPEVRALADDVYRFLAQRFRDRDGTYFFAVTRSGAPSDRRKVLYGQAFAILGLARYARVFGVEAAEREALACFRALEPLHDPTHGGYDQRTDPSWLSSGAAKETNTHLHLLEAFTELYDLSGDALVRERLAELVALFTDRIAAGRSYLPAEFVLD